MAETSDIIQTADTTIAGTYQRFPVVLTRGQGCTVSDEAGNSYIDFVAGIAVCNLGHAHPDVAKAVAAQAETLVHVSNLYYTAPQVEAARRLVEHVLDQRAAAVAAVMSLDATNVFVTITAREMNPDVTIIARGENPRTEKKLLGCGADRVVLPTAIGAQKVAQLITRPTAENILEQLEDLHRA